jgi:predicted RNase H-like HicB family nuclease
LTTKHRYPAQVFWSDEDQCFIALALDLPGCSAGGDTQAHALGELESAIEAWIEAASSAGNTIPKPSNPAAKPQFSGRFVVRMPKELHAKLSSKAETEGVSLNTLIVYHLSSACSVDPMRELRGTIAPWGMTKTSHLPMLWNSAQMGIHGQILSWDEAFVLRPNANLSVSISQGRMAQRKMSTVQQRERTEANDG